MTQIKYLGFLFYHAYNIYCLDDFILVILTILLTNKSLQMDLYEVYNLPALHPELGVQFSYIGQSQYLAVFKYGLYAWEPA